MLRGEGGDFTGHRVAVLLGRILSLRRVCPAGLVLSRGIQKLLEQLLGIWQWSKEGKRVWHIDYTKHGILSDWATAELRVWAGRGRWKLRCSVLRESSDVIAFVHACPAGGGGVVAERTFTGTGGPGHAVEQLCIVGWEAACALTVQCWSCSIYGPHSKNFITGGRGGSTSSK
jgi:hypothetical protein